MDAHRVAFNTWQEKTEWVQKDKRFDVLLPWGKHRADVLKEYIDYLEARCAALAAENACLMQLIDWPKQQCPTTGDVTDVEPADFIPSTSAFLAEVRAQGVEMAAKSEQFSTWVQQGLRSFAIGVRQGDEQ